MSPSFMRIRLTGYLKTQEGDGMDRAEYWRLVALWKAVLDQAVRDVTSCRVRPRSNRGKASIKWFSKRNEYFLDICEMAHVDPDKYIMDARANYDDRTNTQ